jgi:hypothetical protein
MILRLKKEVWVNYEVPEDINIKELIEDLNDLPASLVLDKWDKNTFIRLGLDSDGFIEKDVIGYPTKELYNDGEENRLKLIWDNNNLPKPEEYENV